MKGAGLYKWEGREKGRGYDGGRGLITGQGFAERVRAWPNERGAVI